MNNVRPQCRFVAALITAFLLIPAMLASAQTTQNGPANDPSGGDSGGNKTLIATVFGEPLYLEQFIPPEAETKRTELSPAEFDKWLRDFQIARLYERSWEAACRRYKVREKIDVSEEELAALRKSVERNLKSRSGGPEESPFPSLEEKGLSVGWARAGLIDWKVCKSLYEKYGGRVGIGSLGAWTALDGQDALLQEHQKAGDIKFHDAAIEAAFWEYAQRENFADAYPKGDRLQQLLATPPYLLADATAPVDQTKRERIGSALGKDIYRDELKDNPPTYHQVVKLFMAPAMEEYEREHGGIVEMTDDEIRAGVEWMEAEMKKQGGARWEQWQAQSKVLQASADKRLADLKRQLDDPATPEEQRPMLKTAWRVTALESTHPHAGEVWLIMHRRKFEYYINCNNGGGRIIHQQFGPEALDARRNLLLELEKYGKFEITDPELRKLAYDYWERPNHPGGFHTDHRLLLFPWTKEYQKMMQEKEGPASAKTK